MPQIVDDPRYLAALTATEAAGARQLAEYRKRLADRIVGKVAEAVDSMSGFNEDHLRRALADIDAIYVEESMAYIRRSLLESGEIEVAKKLDEFEAALGRDGLPPVLRSAFDEMHRGGMLPRQPPPSPPGLTEPA
jgi:hypothetical protein